MLYFRCLDLKFANLGRIFDSQRLTKQEQLKYRYPHNWLPRGLKSAQIWLELWQTGISRS
jgi:hypothetical protein